MTYRPKIHQKVHRLITAATLICFVCSPFTVDLSFAAVGGRIQASGGLSPTPNTGEHTLPIEDFSLMPRLGEIAYRYTGDNQKTIINIQDAHCNYSAQQSIQNIIKYAHQRYGVKLVCPEGGAGAYDLEVFTDIENDEVRMATADYFVQSGLMNGSEFYAVRYPDTVELFGMEDPDLYLENLNIYRVSLAYQKTALDHISTLKKTINALKLKIYTDFQKDFDIKRIQYEKGQVDIKKYLSYLFKLAMREKLKISDFPHLEKFITVLLKESKIDFNEAGRERRALIDALSAVLPEYMLKDLAVKTLEFKDGNLTNEDFYRFLFKKAGIAKIKLNTFTELDKYADYMRGYEHIDKNDLFGDIKDLQGSLAGRIFHTEEAMDIYSVGIRMTILEELFKYILVKDKYTEYQTTRHKYGMRENIKTILNLTGKYQIRFQVDPAVYDIDDYRRQSEGFYEYSLRRDDAFLKNVEAKLGAGGSAILVTGGFHSENLRELFKSKGYTYIEIRPAMTPSGDENPYFDLLAGDMGEAIETMSSIKGNNIQIWTMFAKEDSVRPLQQKLAARALALYIQTWISQGLSADESVAQITDNRSEVQASWSEAAAYLSGKSEEDLASVASGKETALSSAARINMPEILPDDYTLWENDDASQSDLYLSDDGKSIVKVFTVSGWTDEHAVEYMRLVDELRGGLPDRIGEYKFKLIDIKLVRFNGALALHAPYLKGRAGLGSSPAATAIKKSANIFLDTVDDITGGLADRRSISVAGEIVEEDDYMNFMVSRENGENIITNIDPINAIFLVEKNNKKKFAPVVKNAVTWLPDGFGAYVLDTLSQSALYKDLALWMKSAGVDAQSDPDIFLRELIRFLIEKNKLSLEYVAGDIDPDIGARLIVRVELPNFGRHVDILNINVSGETLPSNTEEEIELLARPTLGGELQLNNIFEHGYAVSEESAYSDRMSPTGNIIVDYLYGNDIVFSDGIRVLAQLTQYVPAEQFKADILDTGLSDALYDSVGFNRIAAAGVYRHIGYDVNYRLSPKDQWKPWDGEKFSDIEKIDAEFQVAFPEEDPAEENIYQAELAAVSSGTEAEQYKQEFKNILEFESAQSMRPITASVPITAFKFARLINSGSRLDDFETKEAVYSEDHPDYDYFVFLDTDDAAFIEMDKGQSGIIYSEGHGDCLSLCIKAKKGGKDIIGHVHIFPGEERSETNSAEKYRAVLRYLNAQSWQGIEIGISIDERFNGFPKGTTVDDLENEARLAGVKVIPSALRPYQSAPYQASLADSITTKERTLLQIRPNTGDYYFHPRQWTQAADETVPVAASGTEYNRVAAKQRIFESKIAQYYTHPDKARMIADFITSATAFSGFDLGRDFFERVVNLAGEELSRARRLYQSGNRDTAFDAANNVLLLQRILNWQDNTAMNDILDQAMALETEILFGNQSSNLTKAEQGRIDLVIDSIRPYIDNESLSPGDYWPFLMAAIGRKPAAIISPADKEKFDAAFEALGKVSDNYVFYQTKYNNQYVFGHRIAIEKAVKKANLLIPHEISLEQFLKGISGDEFGFLLGFPPADVIDFDDGRGGRNTYTINVGATLQHKSWRPFDPEVQANAVNFRKNQLRIHNYLLGRGIRLEPQGVEITRKLPYTPPEAPITYLGELEPKRFTLSSGAEDDQYYELMVDESERTDLKAGAVSLVNQIRALQQSGTKPRVYVVSGSGYWAGELFRRVWAVLQPDNPIEIVHQSESATYESQLEIIQKTGESLIVLDDMSNTGHAMLEEMTKVRPLLQQYQITEERIIPATLLVSGGMQSWQSMDGKNMYGGGEYTWWTGRLLRGARSHPAYPTWHNIRDVGKSKNAKSPLSITGVASGTTVGAYETIKSLSADKTNPDKVASDIAQFLDDNLPRQLDQLTAEIAAETVAADPQGIDPSILLGLLKNGKSFIQLQAVRAFTALGSNIDPAIKTEVIDWMREIIDIDLNEITNYSHVLIISRIKKAAEEALVQIEPSVFKGAQSLTGEDAQKIFDVFGKELAEFEVIALPALNLSVRIRFDLDGPDKEGKYYARLNLSLEGENKELIDKILPKNAAKIADYPAGIGTIVFDFHRRPESTDVIAVLHSLEPHWHLNKFSDEDMERIEEAYRAVFEAFAAVTQKMNLPLYSIDPDQLDDRLRSPFADYPGYTQTAEELIINKAVIPKQYPQFKPIRWFRLAASSGIEADDVRRGTFSNNIAAYRENLRQYLENADKKSVEYRVPNAKKVTARMNFFDGNDKNLFHTYVYAGTEEGWADMQGEWIGRIAFDLYQDQDGKEFIVIKIVQSTPVFVKDKSTEQISKTHKKRLGAWKKHVIEDIVVKWARDNNLDVYILTPAGVRTAKPFIEGEFIPIHYDTPTKNDNWDENTSLSVEHRKGSYVATPQGSHDFEGRSHYRKYVGDTKVTASSGVEISSDDAFDADGAVTATWHDRAAAQIWEGIRNNEGARIENLLGVVAHTNAVLFLDFRDMFGPYINELTADHRQARVFHADLINRFGNPSETSFWEGISAAAQEITGDLRDSTQASLLAYAEAETAEERWLIALATMGESVAGAFVGQAQNLDDNQWQAWIEEVRDLYTSLEAKAYALVQWDLANRFPGKDHAIMMHGVTTERLSDEESQKAVKGGFFTTWDTGVADSYAEDGNIRLISVPFERIVGLSWIHGIDTGFVVSAGEIDVIDVFSTDAEIALLPKSEGAPQSTDGPSWQTAWPDGHTWMYSSSENLPLNIISALELLNDLRTSSGMEDDVGDYSDARRALANTIRYLLSDAGDEIDAFIRRQIDTHGDIRETLPAEQERAVRSLIDAYNRVSDIQPGQGFNMSILLGDGEEGQFEPWVAFAMELRGLLRREIPDSAERSLGVERVLRLFGYYGSRHVDGTITEPMRALMRYSLMDARENLRASSAEALSLTVMANEAPERAHYRHIFRELLVHSGRRSEHSESIQRTLARMGDPVEFATAEEILDSVEQLSQIVIPDRSDVGESSVRNIEIQIRTLVDGLNRMYLEEVDRIFLSEIIGRLIGVHGREGTVNFINNFRYGFRFLAQRQIPLHRYWIDLFMALSLDANPDVVDGAIGAIATAYPYVYEQEAFFNRLRDVAVDSTHGHYPNNSYNIRSRVSAIYALGQLIDSDFLDEETQTEIEEKLEGATKGELLLSLAERAAKRPQSFAEAMEIVNDAERELGRYVNENYDEASQEAIIDLMDILFREWQDRVHHLRAGRYNNLKVEAAIEQIPTRLIALFAPIATFFYTSGSDAIRGRVAPLFHAINDEINRQVILRTQGGEETEKFSSGMESDYAGDEIGRLYEVYARLTRDANEQLASEMGLSKGDIVVDAGSGTGAGSRIVADLVGESGKVIGVELSGQMVDEAELASKDYPQIQYVTGDARNVSSLIDDQINALTAFNLVHLLEDDALENALSDWYEKIPGGGKLGFNTGFYHGANVDKAAMHFTAIMLAAKRIAQEKYGNRKDDIRTPAPVKKYDRGIDDYRVLIEKAGFEIVKIKQIRQSLNLDAWKALMSLPAIASQALPDFIPIKVRQEIMIEAVEQTTAKRNIESVERNWLQVVARSKKGISSGRESASRIIFASGPQMAAMPATSQMIAEGVSSGRELIKNSFKSSEDDAPSYAFVLSTDTIGDEKIVGSRIPSQALKARQYANRIGRKVGITLEYALGLQKARTMFVDDILPLVEQNTAKANIAVMFSDDIINGLIDFSNPDDPVKKAVAAASGKEIKNGDEFSAFINEKMMVHVATGETRPLPPDQVAFVLFAKLNLAKAVKSSGNTYNKSLINPAINLYAKVLGRLTNRQWTQISDDLKLVAEGDVNDLWKMTHEIELPIIEAIKESLIVGEFKAAVEILRSL